MMNVLPVEQIVGYLKVLRDAATEACDVARVAKPAIDGAINWGDLFCTEAALVIDDDGFSGYRVTIQEADPTNQDFQQWVEDWLKERGHDAIVVTEW